MSWALYTDFHDNLQEDFWRWFNFVDENCRDCAHYTRGKINGYPVHGCLKNVDFLSLINKDCTEKTEKQTTLLDMVK